MNDKTPRCKDCGKRPAGERDDRSPYCGSCDPYGAKFFDDTAGGQP